MLSAASAGPWAIATVVQIRGQRVVPPSQAQVITSTDALFSTAFAGFLGGSEQHLGWLGWVGAAVITFASLSAALFP